MTKILLFLGTRAQIIKMAPVMKLMERRKIDYILLLTGQHKATLEELLSEFRVVTQPIYLYSGKEASSIFRILVWLYQTVKSLVKIKQAYFSTQTIVVTHGDTLTSLLAAVFGRLQNAKVFHVEAGLRSHDLLNPFPEEIIRILVSFLADVHFFPDAASLNNLKITRGEKILTNGNTLLDSVKLALEKTPPIRRQRYAVVSLHRFETIMSPDKFHQALRLVLLLSSRYPVKFVLHPSTEEQLVQRKLLTWLSRQPQIELLPRMGYRTFLQLIAGSQLLLSDGGSNQEETSYLGIPCAVAREASERQEGLGTNARLVGLDESQLKSFLKNLKQYRHKPLSRLKTISPTQIIVDRLSKKI